MSSLWNNFMQTLGDLLLYEKQILDLNIYFFMLYPLTPSLKKTWAWSCRKSVQNKMYFFKIIMMIHQMYLSSTFGFTYQLSMTLYTILKCNMQLPREVLAETTNLEDRIKWQDCVKGRSNEEEDDQSFKSQVYGFDCSTFRNKFEHVNARNWYEERRIYWLDELNEDASY